MRFSIGDRVQKIGGSYQTVGTIMAAFLVDEGAAGAGARYVFRFDEPRGMLHIFNESQLDYALTESYTQSAEADDNVALVVSAFAEQVGDIQQYLKEGETATECIERNRKDVDGMLSLLAKERQRTEDLAAQLVAVENKLPKGNPYCWVDEHATNSLHPDGRVMMTASSVRYTTFDKPLYELPPSTELLVPTHIQQYQQQQQDESSARLSLDTVVEGLIRRNEEAIDAFGDALLTAYGTEGDKLQFAEGMVAKIKKDELRAVFKQLADLKLSQKEA